MEGWHLPIALLCLLFCEVSVAVYKQWIPSTNFEDASNWDKNRTPSETDIVMFDSSKMVSVYVGSTHVLMGAHLPLDGEFILAPGAGFTASDGASDPSPDSDHNIHFLNADRYSWYDPSLWHTDLQNSDHLFSMDAELIPCRHDDVIFPPETSFRVDLGAGGRTISLHSISILGQKFSTDRELAAYLASSTGKLQFHGAGSLRLAPDPCEDPSGCECGNDEVKAWICAFLLQTSGGRCPKPACQGALKPVGQCCEVCGALLFLNYTQAFDLHQYKQRLLHTFLDLPQAPGVRMAISKVRRTPTLRGSGYTARGKRQAETMTQIQLVLTDDGAGPEAGKAAADVAQAILTDVAEQGCGLCRSPLCGRDQNLHQIKGTKASTTPFSAIRSLPPFWTPALPWKRFQKTPLLQRAPAGIVAATSLIPCLKQMSKALPPLALGSVRPWDPGLCGEEGTTELMAAVFCLLPRLHHDT
ncbi:protein amnionless isoform X2 [Vombatus ursinus]|uniref:protein amnionless isoform X2 n=1 Tax=Vombatus ursinus TaxID=29139 RepID=UPI000FFD9ECC|nr:protein amnionless isoform X2 [Vombatus ursinus]